MELQKLRNREVKEDKELLEVEKETYLHIEKGKFKITSNQKPFMSYMLECEDFKPTRFYTGEAGEIIHLEGELPISYLRLKKKGSESMNYISRIVG